MMQFIKKYYIYGIYILILLISIGIYVWGLMINGSNVEGFKKVENLYRTATSLSGKAVHENQLKYLNDNLLKAQADEKTVIDFCIKTSNRSVLYTKVFPEAKADESKIHYMRYAEEYSKAIDNLIGASGLNSGDKPSQLEERNYLDDARRSRSTTGGGAGGGMGMGGFGGMGMGGAAGSDDQKLLAEFRENKASEISIYANETSFVLYDFWKNHDGKSGTPSMLQTDSWLSQLAFWVQEDVVLSINKINDKNKTVKENPVKRLIEISFAGQVAQTGSADTKLAGGGMGMTGGGMGMGMGMAGGRGNTGTMVSRTGGINNLPGFVTAGTESSSRGAAASTSTTTSYNYSLANPWTNHVCDDLIDVVHLKLSVVMTTDNVNSFINALQSSRANIDGSNLRNQITVLEYDIIPVNIQAEEMAGYYYGSGAIAKVDFICEYVFFKDGYKTVVPAPIEQLINPSEESSGNTRFGM